MAVSACQFLVCQTFSQNRCWNEQEPPGVIVGSIVITKHFLIEIPTSRRDVLIDHQLIVDDRDTFGDQVCAILRQSKYHRNRRTGEIEGYGKKLSP